MATYRNLQVSFWTDSKVADDFTPEDRYFYIYLMTNPHTNLAGCYELSLKIASNETGYTKEVIENLIQRFEEVHNVIRYSKGTKEVLILNWAKFNWTSSEKTIKGIRKSVSEVKDLEFKGFLESLLNGERNPKIPYGYGMEETFTFTFTDTDMFNKGKGGVGEKPKPSKIKKEFEVLWQLYPRKQGKLKAYEKYEKARCADATFEEVEQGINAYKEYVDANSVDMQYVKMGSTFFSQKAWQDDWSYREEQGNSKSQTHKGLSPQDAFEVAMSRFMEGESDDKIRDFADS